MASASGPPVELPITSSRWPAAGRDGGRAERGRRGRDDRRAGRCAEAQEPHGRGTSDLIRGISASRTCSIERPTLPTFAGFGT